MSNRRRSGRNGGGGFSIVSLIRPKSGENVGGALRAADCYGCSHVNLEGARTRWLRHGTNTQHFQKHAPVFFVDDALDHTPHDTQIVAVDILPGAVSLPDFEHPHRAVYVFGPEDGTLGKRHTDRAQHIVSIPTRYCMNLAAAVNVVLYDRATKL